jgi:tRNA(Arg) A34 adenosine deaminase TadA
VSTTAAAGAQDAWDALEAPWRAALEEAWASWQTGSLGIGAVIVDGAGRIVSRGRNRIVDTRTEPGVLAATMVAHAEMNALATLPVGPVDDLTLYTTLEPCLMCASSIVFVQIPRVRFAAPDPFFHGLDVVLQQHPFAAERMPARDGPLRGEIGTFAQVLPLTVILFWNPEGEGTRLYRDLIPLHMAAAEELVAAQHLAAVASRGGSVVDAIEAVWPQLQRIEGAQG